MTSSSGITAAAVGHLPPAPAPHLTAALDCVSAPMEPQVGSDLQPHAPQKLAGVAEDWPLLLDRSAQLGRFLVTSRGVAEGEVLLREKPLVLGPPAEPAPLCLACHRPLGLLAAPYLCSQCGVAPLCSPACEQNHGFHSARECGAFRAALPLSAGLLSGERAQWQIVLPLRCCLLEKPDELLRLEAHEAERRNTGAWEASERGVVRVLHNHALLAPLPPESIQRVCGILEVNSFEVRGPTDEAGRSECLRGIYPTAAFMAHCCVPNTHVAIGQDSTLVVKAATALVPGQPVLYNYADALMCTALRREYLRLGKYFSCTCRRCRDPTELGSHLSSLRCPDVTCQGVVTCENPLEQATSVWRCDSCPRSVDPRLVMEGLRSVQRQLSEMDRGSTVVMEGLLSQLGRSLHRQHAAMLELTQALSGLYREQLLELPQGAAPPTLLRRKLELCAALLPPVLALEPPLSRLRGITLYEMASPLAALASLQRRGSDADGLAAARTQVSEAEERLREAARLLLHEPPGTPEAQLARVALMELRAVRQDLADLDKTLTKRKKQAARRRK